jgi:DNA-directed RNA polymerase sigma subunit (sigma70/sigma32)
LEELRDKYILLAKSVSPDMDSGYNAEHIQHILDMELRTLPQKEEWVLREHYSLYSDIPGSLAYVGRLVNVSRERARQKETDGIRKLRNRSRISIIKTNGFADDIRVRSEAVKPEDIGIKWF